MNLFSTFATPITSPMTMPAIHSLQQPQQLSLTNDLQEVTRLTAFVEHICSAFHLNDDATADVNLAVEEAVANVICYAYPEGTRGNIHISASAEGGKLIFEIRDKGKPFDPTTVAEPDITAEAADRQIGGLGIFLIRHYMDDVRYERRNHENILTLTYTRPYDNDHHQPGQ